MHRPPNPFGCKSVLANNGFPPPSSNKSHLLTVSGSTPASIRNAFVDTFKYRNYARRTFCRVSPPRRTLTSTFSAADGRKRLPATFGPAAVFILRDYERTRNAEVPTIHHHHHHHNRDHHHRDHHPVHCLSRKQLESIERHRVLPTRLKQL